MSDIDATILETFNRHGSKTINSQREHLVARSGSVPDRDRFCNPSSSVTTRRYSDDATEKALRHANELQMQMTMSIAALKRAKEELRKEKERWASRTALH